MKNVTLKGSVIDNYHPMHRLKFLLAKHSVYKYALLLFIALTTNYVNTIAQISGTVFRDYNNNGTRQTTAPNEPLGNGVIVNIYNATEQLVASYTSSGATAPNYTVPATGTAYNGTPGSNTGFVASGTAVRLEFIIPTAYGNGGTGISGTNNNSSVRFLNAGATAVNVNFGVFTPNEFFQANPRVIIPRYFQGAATLSTTKSALVSFPYNYGEEKDGSTTATAGTWTNTFSPPAGYAPTPTQEATQSQIGTTYGLGWRSNSKTLYLGAYLRRRAPLGSGGLGAIYYINNPVQNATTNNPQLYVNLNTIFSNTPGGTLGFTRETNASYDWNNDNGVVSLVGRRGLGDIEVNNAQDTLYTIGLNDRKLYAVPTSGALNNTTIKSYDFISSITSLTGVAAAQFANSEIHPFAIGVNPRDNFIYIGGVYGDDGNGTSSANIRMLVWRYNPTNGIVSLVLNEFLGYGRSGNYGFGYGATPINIPATAPAGGAALFRAWTDVFTDNSTSSASSIPTAMLTDIAFDGDVMILAFRDRHADQTPVSGVGPGDNPYTRGNGEIIRVHNVSGTWTTESAGISRDGNTGANITGSTVASTGPGSGEFYHEEWASDGDIAEATMGSLLMIPGKENIMATAFDPVKVNQNNQLVFGNVNANGVQTHSNITGKNVGAFEVIVDAAGSAADGFAKTNGIGDIEALLDAPAIEIGNRVWNDVNGDGIQNAGEAGIGGVVLEIFADFNGDGLPDGTSLGTVTTASTGDIGSWYFNSSNITDGDPSTTGNQAGLKNNATYLIRPASSAWTGGVGAGNLAGYQLTKSNANSNGAADFSDNDAIIVSTIPQISVTTGVAGVNNHTLDFGFKQLASIGDRVWLDNGVGGGTTNDGIQNGTEPGVAGVTVTLYQNGADGNSGTSDDIIIGTTVTDAYGNYLFDNLTPSTSVATMYSVGFTLPSNHQFTTQTNTQNAGTSDITNTTITTGVSTATNGSDVNVNTGRTGSFWLAPGEAERGADAGLIFNTPTLLNSIGDRVWLDTDGNGLQNGTEPGVAGVTVTLYASDGVTVIATTVTDANGNYIFTGLPANTNYIVGFTLPAGMLFTTKDQTAGGGNDTNDSDVNTTGVNFGKTDAVNTGAAGTQVTSVDAGVRTQPAGTASLGDKVWNDINNNGTQDAGEPGIAGVTVNLYEDTNGDGVLTGGELTAVRTTTTDAFGNYIFNNLIVTANNRWQVEFVQPSGYTNTAVANNNSGNDATDSDITNNTTDRTGFIRLKDDERNMNVDAGFVQTTPAGALQLGDKVWKDIDADGQQDNNEPGVAGITVKLYQNGPDGLPGTADDVLVGTTTTDVNGNYLFVNLAASTGTTTNYNVQFSNLPTGYTFTTQDAGADATDSDVNSIGKTGSINLTANNLTIDAGIKQGIPSGLGSLGNKVWNDLSNNGLQDAGELGVAGVTVTLKDGSGNDIDSDPNTAGVQPTVTVTNALGEYMFTNLPAGSYTVQFSNMPLGYVIAGANAGTNDANGDGIQDAGEPDIAG